MKAQVELNYTEIGRHMTVLSESRVQASFIKASPKIPLKIEKCGMRSQTQKCHQKREDRMKSNIFDQPSPD